MLDDESAIADCAASESVGGGLWADHANVTLKGRSRVERCEAGRGGGMLAYRSDVALLDGCIVSECRGGSFAGGLHLQLGCKQWSPLTRAVSRPHLHSHPNTHPPVSYSTSTLL